jgi:cyclase
MEKQNMHYGASHLIFKRAEELRKFPTHEEEIIWGFIKANQLKVKFRRQHPISFFIVDLYCHSKKLVIEIDGSIHDVEEKKIRDEIRQKDLEALGLKIIRFTTYEIKNNIESVLQIIEKHLK